jgi:hypothetical protein
MKKLQFIPLLLIMLIAGCSGKKRSENAPKSWDDLKSEVMAVHDEIMPKMGKLMALKKQIDEKIGKLEAEDPDAEQLQQLRNISTSLENSHDKMMQWMREYNPNFEGMVEQEIMEYLDMQKQKIKDVGEMTSQSIKKAEEALQ